MIKARTWDQRSLTRIWWHMSGTSSVGNLALWERRRKWRCVHYTCDAFMFLRHEIGCVLAFQATLPTEYLLIVVKMMFKLSNTYLAFSTSISQRVGNCLQTVKSCFCLAKLLHQLEHWCGVEVAQKDGLHYQFNFRQAAFIICVVLHQVLIESRNAFSYPLRLFLLVVLEIKWGYCKCSLFLSSKWDMIGKTICSLCY